MTTKHGKQPAASSTGRERMDAIISLAKRRGFVFPSADIYGGIGGFYDFGPLGAQLKRNIEATWWKAFVEERDDVLGLDASIITNRKVWEASEHIGHFNDPLVECKTCHERFRADDRQAIEEHPHQDSFTDPRPFHTMFKTFVGALDDDTTETYLRPETAQGIFTNFINVATSMRMKLPFGIAQIGKSFRNEITYRNFLFRLREFTIAELEYFVKPGEDEEAFDRWLTFMEKVLTERFGLPKEKLTRYETPVESLAHYSKRTVDIHYAYPWGNDELFAIANRTDYDLKRHEKMSGKKLAYRDPVTNESYIPYVIEPTGGIERLLLAILNEAYTVVEGGRTTTTESAKEEEVVLRLPKHLAPIQAAVLPLSKKAELGEVAQELAATFRKDFRVAYDDVASIGRRYRRQDEIGTPYCVTVDFDSLTDNKATVRDRDTMTQERVALADLPAMLKEKCNA